MSTLRLNALAIRTNHLPVKPPDCEPSLLEALGVKPLLISRRDLLKLAGAAVVTGAVAADSLKPIVQAESGVHARGAWLRAGSNRASIDPAAFSGNPRLTLSTANGWSALLEGARYPGTTIPAGMALLVVGSGVRSRLRIRHELGDFETEVPLASWLSGDAAAQAVVRLNKTLDLGEGQRLALSGLATATLMPDWSMRLEGTDIARLSGLGAKLVASAVTIALAAQEAPSLLSRRIARRTLITLEAGTNAWKTPLPSIGAAHALDIAPGALDRVTIETAETGAGAVRRAIVAFSAAEGAATYTPASSRENASTPVPLKNLRVAQLLDGSGAYHVAAEFGTPSWVHALGQTLLVGAASWAAPFELAGDRLRSHISVEPAVLGIAADIPGAIASPIQFPASAKPTIRLDAGTGSGYRGGPANSPAPAFGFNRSGITVVPLPLASYVNITRPDDLLQLRIELFNMSIVTDRAGRKSLTRTNGQQAAYISVNFPGQHAVERAYMDSQTPGTAPYQAYLADESRLAFEVPDKIADAGIEYSLLGTDGKGAGGLLDWSDFTHVVVPTAHESVEYSDMKRLMWQPRAGSYAEVGPTLPPETSLEIPWGLYMSPEPGASWSHRVTPLTMNDRTELWYTKLHGAKELSLGFSSAGAAPNPGTGIPGIDLPPIDWAFREKSPTLRAVWSRHYDLRLTSDTPVPYAPTAGLFRNSFTTSLSDSSSSTNDIGGIQERWSVTDLSGRYHDNPVNINNLMLTALGAWMDSQGSWATDELALTKAISTELMQWDHRMTMGRDQYVKIVKFGRLFPFGHKAVKITITERKVKTGNPFAFLEQQTFIMVRQPVLDFSVEADPIKRRLPFTRVELKTLQTPPISGRTVTGVANKEDAFWPEVSAIPGQEIQWAVDATDLDGKVHHLSMPLIFVRGYVAGKYDVQVPYAMAEPILDTCATEMAKRQISFSGKTVAFAKKPTSGDGSSRILPTNWMKFTAEVFDPSVGGAARYMPLMDSSNVQLDAVEEMTNQRAGTTIKIADQYRDSGFSGANAAGMVFAAIVTAPSLGFPAELSGALATPIPTLSGISALKGPIGGALDQVASGEFNPAELFTVLDAKIIGGIKLIDVLGEVLGIDKMPVFEKVKDALDADTLIVQFDWETEVKSSSDNPADAIFKAEASSKLKLHAEIRKKIKDASAPPSSTVTGELGPFTLQLLPPLVDAIHLKFEKLAFESLDGGSPTVTPDITDVEFVGVLKYLQELAKYLGPVASASGASMPGSALATTTDGVTVVDSGPFKIDVDGSGIKASMTLQLPDITIGVFSLKNMSFFAGLTLPFDGSAVLLDFSFCSRESPFELLVMGFGGGGYVLMQLATDGLRMLEISLEFGAGTSFSIGSLASGSVEIKGGFSLRFEKKAAGDEITFKIFIRIQGSLRVIGLITVTITFYLELSYRSFTCPGGGDGDELTGTATLTIEIEILFFSTSVDLSVTKTLAGSDPRFKDRMPEQSDWDDYCASFVAARLGA